MALAEYLADTSVFARLHRPAVLDAVAPLIDRGLVATCSIIDLEVQYSARSCEEYARVSSGRAGFEGLVMDQEVWDAAILTQGMLAAQGRLRAVGVPDLLIAATAARHRVTASPSCTRPRLRHSGGGDGTAHIVGRPALDADTLRLLPKSRSGGPVTDLQCAQAKRSGRIGSSISSIGQ